MSSFRSAISFFPHDNYHRNLVTDFNPYLFSTATARHWEYRINMQIWVTWRKMGLIIRREHIVSGKQSLIAPVILIKVGKISEFKWPELFSRNYILTFSSAFDQFWSHQVTWQCAQIFFFKIYLRNWTFFIINLSMYHRAMMTMLAEFSRRVLLIFLFLWKVVSSMLHKILKFNWIFNSFCKTWWKWIMIQEKNKLLVRPCDQAIVHADHQLPILCKGKINPLAPLLLS